MKPFLEGASIHSEKHGRDQLLVKSGESDVIYGRPRLKTENYWPLQFFSQSFAIKRLEKITDSNFPLSRLKTTFPTLLSFNFLKQIR